MIANAYEITLISASMRVARTVIAHGAIQAARIAIKMMPEQNAPLAIICKPLHLQKKGLPCSA